MDAQRATPKKTYRMNSAKYKGHMTVTDNGQAVVLFAGADKPSIEVFTCEKDARVWASKELGAEFVEDRFYDLLNALLNLQERR